MGETDQLGERGEWICKLKLTAVLDEDRLFRPVFLGEKWPDVDLLVELVKPTPGGRRGFFFAQVKTTQMGYQENGRLKIPAIAREKVEALGIYPIPTYILGVDEPQEKVYIVAVQGKLAGMSSMSCEHELTQAHLTALRDEVEVFWDGLGPTSWKSRFREQNWEVTS